MRKIIALSLLSVLMAVSSLWAQGEDFVYDAHNKRDPFWPLVTPTGTIVSYDTDISVYDMNLEGIIVDPDGNNAAIINGIIVQKQDKVGNYVILEIKQRSIVLLKGQEKIELKLKKED